MILLLGFKPHKFITSEFYKLISELLSSNLLVEINRLNIECSTKWLSANKLSRIRWGNLVRKIAFL